MSSCLFLQKLIAAFSCTKRGINNSSESAFTMILPCDKKIHTRLSLWNLPDVVMRIIFNRLGLNSILTLRKVCRDLRIRIDYIKPEANLLFVSVIVEDCKYLITYGWTINVDLNHGTIYRDYVEYSKAVESGKSIVRCNGVEKIVNDNFLELALRDFLLILKFQWKSIKLSVRTETEYSNYFIQFWETLKSFLAIENQLLKVSQIEIDAIDQKSAVKALSLIDPQSIEKITLVKWKVASRKLIEFAEIMEMEHWKTADSFSTSCSITGVSVQNFRHFSLIEMHYESIETLLEFKKIFENSTEAYWFEIWCDDTLEIREQLLEKWGPAFIVYKEFGWFFRMSTTDDDVLLIVLDEPSRFIHFLRQAVADIPKRAVIQN